MISALRAVTLCVTLFATASLHATEMPTAPPEELGLSPERLQAITERLQKEIDNKSFPGAVLLIARHGKIGYFESVGKRTPGGPDMTSDSIFRIYSMTKPLTTVAAMILVEEGRLGLADPVSMYIPEFKDMKVALDQPGASQLEPAKGRITIQDLMRHTAGLTYGFFGTGTARDAYKAAGIGNDAWTNAEFARQIAAMPLEHQPGTTWEYSHATDVLGAVVEAISGKKLSEFIKARITDPLGMDQTGFKIAKESDFDLLAQPFPGDDKIGTFPLDDVTKARNFESGGGGMVSTARDYARFLQMLLNGGELDGTRILSPKTIAFMTADHLGEHIKRGKYYLPGDGYSFGLGFGVRTAAGQSIWPGTVGDYYWGGAAGTYFWVDPKEDLFVVYMMVSPKHRVPMRAVLRDMVYAAVVESQIGAEEASQ